MEVSEGTQPRARRPEMSEKEWQNSLKASLVPPQPTAPLAPCTMEHNFSTISFFINGMTAGSRTHAWVPEPTRGFRACATEPTHPHPVGSGQSVLGTHGIFGVSFSGAVLADGPRFLVF